MVGMIGKTIDEQSGVYINSNVADLLDVDYDGDELSISKPKERCNELSVMMTMGVGSLLFSKKSPRVEHIGEHRAVPLGFIEGNIINGYLAEDLFKARTVVWWPRAAI